MTGMLASVMSVKEAKIVIKNNVDIVDIKNPKQGALGALNYEAVKCIVKTVNGQVPVSATIGDIDVDDEDLLEKIMTMTSTGVDFVKVGLFANSPSENYLNVIKHAAKKGVKLVIVMFAEEKHDNETIDKLINSGVSGLMIDTRSKSEKRLTELLSEREIQSFVTTVHAHGLFCGLAGSLKYQDIPQLLSSKADYLGFRGALCRNNERISSVSTEQVKLIRQAIPKAQCLLNEYKLKHTETKEVTHHVSMA